MANTAFPSPSFQVIGHALEKPYNGLLSVLPIWQYISSATIDTGLHDIVPPEPQGSACLRHFCLSSTRLMASHDSANVSQTKK